MSARRRTPSSDHFDGRRFFNPGEVARRGFGAFLRWQRHRRPARWPTGIIDPPFPPPSPPPHGHAALTFIGHASFLIRFAGLALLTDPIFSERCSPVSWAGPRRVRPPGLVLDELPPPDLVLVSHCHYDHMDLPSLRALHRRFAPRFITTRGNAGFLARAGIPGAVELDWWQQTEWRDARIVATPARHFAARTPFDRNRTLWAGFMMVIGGGRLLFAGDSGAGTHWREIRRRLGPPDLALLPIGAYEPRWFMAPVHMNPDEAVAAHRDLAARSSVGMHFGTFQLTDEPIDAPLIALAAAREAAGLPEAAFTTLGFGETRLYPMAGDPRPATGSGSGLGLG